jgi:tetratricopeptide (TPR) repeat protein
VKIPRILAVAGLVAAPCALQSQTSVSLPEASPAASVSQVVGISEVTVVYHRPSVLKREIWGGLVPYGFNDLGFGTSKAAPWRAGANENTLISFQHDVSVAGMPLKAGTYGLFMAPAPDGTVAVIFSSDTGAWGSFFYDPAHDALRVAVKWQDAPFHEQLTYDFSDVTKDSAVLALSWERRRIPIPLRFDTVAITVANLKREIAGAKQFRNESWVEASAYLLDNNVELPLALAWADHAVSDGFVGVRSFRTLSNKADILERLGRAAEASAVMDEALKLGTTTQIHQYARSQLAKHNTARALEIFKLNAQRHPDVWPVNYGLARGYSAVGDYKAALAALLRAQAQVPDGDAANAAAIRVNIEKLRRGQDIN